MFPTINDLSNMLARSDNSTCTMLICRQVILGRHCIHLPASYCHFQVHTLSHLCLFDQTGITATPSLPPNHHRRTTRTSATTRPCSGATRPGWSPLLEPSSGPMTCSCLLRSVQACKYIHGCCSNVACVIAFTDSSPGPVQTICLCTSTNILQHPEGVHHVRLAVYRT